MPAIPVSVDWTRLVVEPKAVLVPYEMLAPPLSSFAIHSVRFDLSQVLVAGQFLVLPKTPIPNWRVNSQDRAYATFSFGDTRNVRVCGTPPIAKDDDANHGLPVGTVGVCTLVALPDFVVSSATPKDALHWKRFEFRASDFSVELESLSVGIACGARAWRSHGWQI
jgi:hypothetical protein